MNIPKLNIGTYQGYMSVDRNALFSTHKFYKGFKVCSKIYEVKDDVNVSELIIGEEYNMNGLIK